MRGKREALHGPRQGRPRLGDSQRCICCAGVNFRPSEWNGHCEDWPGDVDTRCIACRQNLRKQQGSRGPSCVRELMLASSVSLGDTNAASAWVQSRCQKSLHRRHLPRSQSCLRFFFGSSMQPLPVSRLACSEAQGSVCHESGADCPSSIKSNCQKPGFGFLSAQRSSLPEVARTSCAVRTAMSSPVPCRCVE